MKIKGESEKVGLNLNIQKTKIMASDSSTGMKSKENEVISSKPRPFLKIKDK